MRYFDQSNSLNVRLEFFPYWIQIDPGPRQLARTLLKPQVCLALSFQQQQRITARWSIPSYTACCQKHTSVNDLGCCPKARRPGVEPATTTPPRIYCIVSIDYWSADQYCVKQIVSVREQVQKWRTSVLKRVIPLPSSDQSADSLPGRRTLTAPQHSNVIRRISAFTHCYQRYLPYPSYSISDTTTFLAYTCWRPSLSVFFTPKQVFALVLPNLNRSG